MEAIILDGEQKSALAAVRSLGRRGVRCIVGSKRKTGMALHSRYVSETFVYTSPLDNQEAFLSDVIAQCSVWKEKPVLFAFSDASFLPIARARKRVLKHASMALPSAESVEIAFDKARTMEFAQKIGIPIPQTHTSKNQDGIEALLKNVTYPAVVKPRHSATWKGEKGVSGSVIFALSKDELAKAVEFIARRTGETPIVEEYITGDEYGIELLAEHGRVVQWFAHKRIRSFSPTGGASVVKESIELPDDLKKHSARLMERLSWHGPAMVEFKRDSKHGNEALLLEINGRFWGSLPLPIQAGVDFPHLYLQLSHSEPPGANVPYTPQVITRYFLGDIKNLLTVLFKNDPMRPLAYPSRRKAFRDFFMVPPRTRYDVLSFSDPLPFFAEAVDRLIQ